MNDRYVIACLARGRQEWFSNIARWSTSGVTPIEVVKCLSSDELRTLFATGRRFSAVLVDASTPGLDRHLVDLAASTGCPTIVVADGRVHRDWQSIGCSTVLSDPFSPDDLRDVLAESAHPVDREVRRIADIELGAAVPAQHGQVIAVMGSGGVGSSTVAMLTAQALARAGRSTVLVDGVRRAQLAMLHDVGDVVPGLPELVEAHRADRLAPDQIRELTFDIASRGYALLLGLRQSHEWTAMRQRSIEAALDGLTRTFQAVVIDVDSDLDGEALTGSVDVGDRHAMTASSLETADLVLLVAHHDLKGLASVERLYDEATSGGIDPRRCVVVLNRADRSPARRALATRALSQLIGSESPTPLFIKRIRNVDDLHHRCAALPSGPVERHGRAVLHLLDSMPAAAAAERDSLDPAVIRPGSLGFDRAFPSDAA